MSHFFTHARMRTHNLGIGAHGVPDVLSTQLIPCPGLLALFPALPLIAKSQTSDTQVLSFTLDNACTGGPVLLFLPPQP